MSQKGVIAGVGLVIPDHDAVARTRELAFRALTAACDDAGLEVGDVDGVIVNRNELVADDHLGLDVARQLGLGTLDLLVEMEAKGTTFCLALDAARAAVESGRARTVAVLFADAAIQPGSRAGAAFAAMGGDRGARGLERAAGMVGAVAAYAFLAQHFFAARDAGEADLAAVAIAQRGWAGGNPLAWNREPLGADEYFASPFVAEPLRRLDCARPVSGAAAVIVTRADRVGSSGRPTVEVVGSAQRATTRYRHAPAPLWEPTGASDALTAALGEAGTTRDAIDVLEIYDPFTVVPLILLEELGFAEPGQAGAFVRDGQTGPGGRIPTNTGGGQISGFYLQGVTPVVEALAQLRGTAGDRQVAGAGTAAVAAIGGRLEHHASLILRRAA